MTVDYAVYHITYSAHIRGAITVTVPVDRYGTASGQRLRAREAAARQLGISINAITSVNYCPKG